ncbi:MAG: ABC transporter permease [Granulosicoccus sp.]|nr:ABC transporter permease [Granulosicoccus sp.]
MTDLALPHLKRRGNLIGALWDFTKSQPLGAMGGLVIVIMFVSAIFAQLVAPYNPTQIDFMARIAPPSAAHLLGTDGFGRDIFSRIVYGARTAMTIGFFAAFFGTSIGAVVGIASAYLGGKTDLIIQRLIDIMLSFPLIVMALIVVAIVPPLEIFGIDFNVIIAITIPFIPKVARVIRASALSIVTMPYVDAARAAGFSNRRIMFRHILPNVAAPYLIMLTALLGHAILLEASLSFLGLGVSEPTPAWGLMLSGTNADYYQEAWWVIVFPGLAISLAVFGFNLFGDSLRDWLDPKLKV